MPKFSSSVALAIFAGSASVLALPAAAPAVTNAAQLSDKRSSGSDSSCTFTGSDGAASASASKTSCATIVLSGITVPSGTTLDLTDLNDGTSVIFQGNTSFGYKEWDGPLVSVSGTDITVTGDTDSVLDGDGSRWWDGKGSNGGTTKPKFFYAHDLISSTITGITLKNTPVQAFSIDGSKGLTLKDITINNKDGDDLDSDGDTLGHNTDAFDIGDSSSITITGATVYNQDDCMAINSGTDITFTGGYCSGGHGLSIGSVGGRSDNTVSGILVENSQIVDSENGVRIKTVSDATGSVSNVTYSGITLSGITSYGIVIEQDYENGSPTGTPTSGVPITDVTITDVTGTVESDAVEIYILCASCSDWTWSDNSITGGETSSKCEGLPSGVSC